MKKCSFCKEIKSFEEFGKCKLGTYGLHAYCRICSNLKTKIYYQKNKFQWKEYNKDQDYALYEKNRRKIDPQFRLIKNLRSRLRLALKKNSKIGSAVRDLGCSIPELKQHLESKFQPGMTWENHGQWHIDHIKPLATFDLSIKEQFLQACNYTNLQPLWKKDHYKKTIEDNKNLTLNKESVSLIL